MATVGNLKVDLGLNSAAFDAGLRRASGSVNSFASTATKALAAFAAAAAAAFSVGAIGRFADEWSDLNSRLTNATGSAEAGAAAMNRLQEVARRSYSSISQTTEAFLSQSTTLNALGVSTQTQLDLTETLNNALVISATRGDKARSVMDAWSKAMALGELRGDNLNSVIANSDRLAQALADSMGVSVNELRRMGSEGKITRKVMLGVTDQLETLREEAENMPATISDGFGILRDSIFQFVGRMDQATGASGNFAAILIAVGDAITSATGPLIRIASIVGDTLGPAFDALGPIIGIATSALAGFFAPAVIAGLGTVSVAIGTTMVGAVRALTAAMLANPLGLLIAGIAAAVTAAFIFRDQIKQIIGIDVIDAVKTAANRIIALFEAAYNAVVTLWQNLPEVFSGLGKRAWNSFIEEFEKPALTINGMTIIPGFDLTGLKATETEAEINALSETVASFSDTLDLNRDYLGDFAAGIGEAWSNATGATGALSELSGALNDSLGGSSGSGKENAFQRATKAIRDNIDALKIQAATFGMSETAAARFTTTMNLLRAAKESNLQITPALRQQIDALAGAFANAQENARNLEKIQQNIVSVNNKLADSFTDMFMAVIEGGKNLGDMIGSLLKDLGRMFIHQGFQSLLGMGGGGGFLGGLFGFARGGTIMPGGAGGIDSQLVMFRKSPNERVDITKPGQTLTSGDSGPRELNFNITVSGARGNAEIRQMVEQGVDGALQTVRQNLPEWVANPRVKFV